VTPHPQHHRGCLCRLLLQLQYISFLFSSK
jgi:hypothetical protein